MALIPFGKGGKSADYHGPSGPNSKGRMPKTSGGARHKAAKVSQGSPVGGLDDNLTNNRVTVSDGDGVTSAPGKLGR